MVYPFNINGEDQGILVRDITTNLRVKKEILDSVTLYDEYDIVDGETPEMIAEKVYGNPLYHWIIMLLNERFDYVDDFPKDYYTLQKSIDAKYGDTANDIHHYEDENGYTVSSDYPLARPISNRTYEEELNESKRRIKLISPSVLPVILKNFEELL